MLEKLKIPSLSDVTEYQTHNQGVVSTFPGVPYPRKWCWFLLFFLLWSHSAIAGTAIEHDPQGFLGIPWGNSLQENEEFIEIDETNIVRTFTLKEGKPRVGGVPMESMKLYTLKGKYARAIFHYRGETTHESLMHFLEATYGKTDIAQGGMMRGLNQQYTWRGPETEITVTYHGFRERGVLAAESRVLAPLFFDAFPDQAY